MWLNEREDLEISRDWSSPDADMEQTDSAYKVRHELSIKWKEAISVHVSSHRSFNGKRRNYNGKRRNYNGKRRASFPFF